MEESAGQEEVGQKLFRPSCAVANVSILTAYLAADVPRSAIRAWSIEQGFLRGMWSTSVGVSSVPRGEGA